MTQGPGFIGSCSPLDNLSPTQREQLKLAIEEGFILRNVSPGAFNLIAERDAWDVAIILDACRFDSFSRTNRIPGTLERRISPASCTEEWVGEVFANPAPDVCYISASPYVSAWYFEQLGMAVPVGRLEEVWRDGWDDALHTVPPRAVTAAYRRLRSEWRRAKFVLHFMQPHHPYIGDVRVAGAGWREFFGAMETDVPRLEGKTPIEMLADGEATHAEVTAAYEANLRLVLDAVTELLPELPPRVVITADHGEAFGECGIFGHPCGLLLPELITVPYLLVGW